MSSLKVLITRPARDATATAALVAAMGFAPVVAPMLTIRSLVFRLPSHVDAVVLSSRNALASLPEALHGLPLFAVGGATAAAARARGFVDVRDADGDAGALLALICRGITGSPALLLATASGEGWALGAALREHGCVVHRRAVYEARAVRRLSPEARAALREGLHAALFFSAATADAFVGAVGRARMRAATEGADACAIGAPAGMALGGLPWRRVRVAARPTQDEVLALLR